MRKIRISADIWHRKLTLKVKFWYFVSASHYSTFQNLVIWFECSWFLAKKFLILYPSLENSTTGIAITCGIGFSCWDWCRSIPAIIFESLFTFFQGHIFFFRPTISSPREIFYQLIDSDKNISEFQDCCDHKKSKDLF